MMLWAIKRQVDNNNDVKDQKGEKTILNVKSKKLMEKSLLLEKNGKKCQFVYQIIDPETWSKKTKKRKTPSTNFRRLLTWPYVLFQVRTSASSVLVKPFPNDNGVFGW